jgi:hypothetical protein
MINIGHELCMVRGGYFVLMKVVVNGFKAVVLHHTIN